MALGSISLNIEGNTSGLEKDITRGVGGAFKRAAGIAAAAFAGIGLTSQFKKGILGASDLNESLNAINVTLGKGAASFIEFGKSSATSLGLTQAALNEAIVPMGALLGNAGSSGDQLSRQLQTLAQRATDVGSVFNATTNEVLVAFGAAMRGEQEPIRQFGVNLNEASIAAKAVELGFAATEKEVSQAAKTQAAYALILDGTKDASGDFRNTSDGLANSLKILEANATELRDEIGARLIPVVTEAVQGLTSIIKQAREGEGPLGTLGNGFSALGGYIAMTFGPTFQTMMERFEQAGPGLQEFGSALAEMGANLFPALSRAIMWAMDAAGLLALALGKVGEFVNDHVVVFGTLATILGTFIGLMKAAAIASGIYTAVTGGLVTAFWALNAAMTANPIGVVVVALAALAAGFVYAWKHSETFRKIVAAAFNGLVTVVIGAIKIMSNIILGFWEGIVIGASKAFGWVPGLGDKLKGAANAIHDFRVYTNSQLDAIKTNIHIVATGDASHAINQMRMLQQAQAAAAGKMIGPIIGPESSRPTVGKVSAPKVGFSGSSMPSSIGGGSGGGAAKKAAAAEKKRAADAAKKAAAAAKKAAQKARDAADKAVGKQITARKFVDNITGGQEQIRTEFDKLIEKLKIGNKKSLAKYANEVQKGLLAIAVRRDRISDTLEVATDRLNELRKTSADYAKSVQNAILATGNIATHNVITFTGIRNNLRHAVRQANEFRTAIASLTKAGLNKQSLDDLIQSGPEAGLEAARSLMQGGKAGIAEVNKLTAQLTAAGTAMGNETANTFYKAGISAAAGLVKGLQSQEAALNAQMDRMAKRMASTLKKQLKIKSPSQVFAGIGEYIGAGLAQGIDASRGRVTQAGNRLGTTIINNVGGVSISGLADPLEMERGGILSGRAVADTIARQQATANLAGMA